MITGAGSGKPIPMLTLTPARDAETAPSRTAESDNNFSIRFFRRTRCLSVSARRGFLPFFL
jgi:hypothetical protein